jgi:hypothetical protein
MNWSRLVAKQHIDKKIGNKYRKLIELSRKQLTHIAERLSNPTSRLESTLFVFRNWRIKQVINSIVWHKQRSAGANSIKEMIDEFTYIENDDTDWKDVGSEEMDYIKLVLNGLHDISDYIQLLNEEPTCHK